MVTNYFRKLLRFILRLTIATIAIVFICFVYNTYKSDNDQEINPFTSIDIKSIIEKYTPKFISDIKTDNSEELYDVLWVSDGDTLCINYKGEERYVRLIGIDTPESVNPDESKNTPEGKIASDYTKSIVTDQVYLEFDIQSEDKYGRLLAYVYLSDGTFLNEKIIKDGYAYTMNIFPNIKYQNVFLEAFEYARENNLGLWSTE